MLNQYPLHTESTCVSQGSHSGYTITPPFSLGSIFQGKKVVSQGSILLPSRVAPLCEGIQMTAKQLYMGRIIRKWILVHVWSVKNQKSLCIACAGVQSDQGLQCWHEDSKVPVPSKKCKTKFGQAAWTHLNIGMLGKSDGIFFHDVAKNLHPRELDKILGWDLDTVAMNSYRKMHIHKFWGLFREISTWSVYSREGDLTTNFLSYSPTLPFLSLWRITLIGAKLSAAVSF